MSILEIITLKDSRIRKKSKPVESFDSGLKLLIDNMFETLHSKPGLGLAAPQIGQNIRLFIVESKEMKDEEGNIIYEKIPRQIFINPEIVRLSKEKVELSEGCFSVPNQYGPVVRPKKIKYRYQDIKGKWINDQVGGLLARVIQHEIDHLNGVLFIDLVEDKSKIKKMSPGQEIQG